MQPRLSKYVILKTTLQNVNYKINVTQQNVNLGDDKHCWN